MVCNFEAQILSSRCLVLMEFFHPQMSGIISCTSLLHSPSPFILCHLFLWIFHLMYFFCFQKSAFSLQTLQLLFLFYLYDWQVLPPKNQYKIWKASLPLVLLSLTSFSAMLNLLYTALAILFCSIKYLIKIIVLLPEVLQLLCTHTQTHARTTNKKNPNPKTSKPRSKKNNQKKINLNQNNSCI